MTQVGFPRSSTIGATRRLLTLLTCAILLLTVSPAQAGTARTTSLTAAFGAAAREFHVPAPLLLALSYNETLWEQHGGLPSTSGGYGLMQLTHVDALQDPGYRDGRIVLRTVPTGTMEGFHSLDLAARLLHEPRSRLERDPVQNIRGAAAVLARYERRWIHHPRTLGDWFPAVALYGGSSRSPAVQFADDVFATMGTGAQRVISSGETVVLTPRAVSIPKRFAAHAQRFRASSPQPECPAKLNCRYIPAAYAVNNPSDPTDYGNYDVATRPADRLAIRYIVIHDTEGSYNSAIASFGNSTRYASANYVIRSTDGQVTQMVPTTDIAWHAGNYFVNQHAIGIEHEGIAVQGATWYTERLYQASARLVRYLAARYNIPLDRAHIIGHDNVPGPTSDTQTSQHWDPGPFWDWQHYMDLLHAPIGGTSPLAQGDIVTIDPSFADNQPAVTNCDSPGVCRDLPPQGANFVYLHTAPEPNSPLVGDPALHSSGTPGTTRADDWGDTAVAGQEFYLADTNSQGDWDAIYFGGKEAWFYDPPDAPTTVPATGMLVTPRQGKQSIPVYGRAYPEASAYPSSLRAEKKVEKIVPLQYSIPAGQIYVSTDLVTSDYYYSPTQTKHLTIVGKTRYYQIFFNHRIAFVKYSDVQVLDEEGLRAVARK